MASSWYIVSVQLVPESAHNKLRADLMINPPEQADHRIVTSMCEAMAGLAKTLMTSALGFPDDRKSRISSYPTSVPCPRTPDEGQTI
ncbi:hypothetical protein CAL14_08365 [Bordetella genomosp. 9]|nr:hypothetical protein CAL14_08365 [Bordetella genomosp. 9]